jgi:hypothetical protein
VRHPVQIGILIACLASLVWGASARAATLVPVGDFDQPIFVTSDPADPGRLLVAEREGRVILVTGSNRQVFANLEAWVQCCDGERGLLSLAPAPDFAQSGRFYAAYTGNVAAGGAVGDIHVDAFTPDPEGGPPLREPIIGIPHAAAIHNGGQVQIGPDGYLYLSVGDAGEDEKAQDQESLLGKLLRIEPRPGEVPAYAAPPDNPFVGTAGRDEIWASGLRNPWRFSFDRLSGHLMIADVGQGQREEVDLALSPSPGVVGGRGDNYGWSCREGTIAYAFAPAFCAGASGFTDPVFDYPHADPGGGQAHGCSITGGYVVRDLGLGDLYGRYLYADFCVGELRSFALPGAGETVRDRSEDLFVFQPVSFGEDVCGRVYVASRPGTVFHLQGDFGGGCLVGPPPPAPLPDIVAAPRPPALVILQARKRGRRAVKLIVRILPCGENAGGVVYLNRNGKTIRQRRLDRHCVARFRLRVGGRTRFRAFFEGQRSQVRKIAFAKPRP